MAGADRMAGGSRSQQATAGCSGIALENPEKRIPEIAYSDNAADDTVQGTEISAVLEKLIAALPAKLRERWFCPLSKRCRPGKWPKL